MAWCPICEMFLSEAEQKNNLVLVEGKPTCGPCANTVIKYETKKMGKYNITRARAKQFKKLPLVRQASGPYGSVKPTLKRSSSYISLSDILKESSYGSVKPIPPPLTRTSSYIGLDDILKDKK